MNDNFNVDEIKRLELIQIQQIRTYHVSLMITFMLLLGVIITTFIYFALPLRNFVLTTAFIGGIIAGVYNLLVEIFHPEKHLHWSFHIPDDYDGWQVLYLISKCIYYNKEKNIVVVQFVDELESLLKDALLNTSRGE